MNKLKRKILSASRLLLLAFCVWLIALSFNNCGRLPPEEFWTGDKDDTTGIKRVIAYYDTDDTSDWQGFLSRLDFLGTIDPLRFKRNTVFPNSEVASLEFKIKQAFYPSKLEISLTSEDTDTNIIFVKDTTATVELITKIKGVTRINCDSVQRYRTDTVIALSRVNIWEDGMTNFPADWTTGGSGGPWTRAANRFKSESTSVKCTPNETYDNNQDNWMQHSVDFSSYELPSVVFWIWKNIESNDSVYFECFDTIWKPFWSTGTGVDTVFRQVEVTNIPKSVSTIRFRFYSDASGTAEGVYIDDVTVTGANATDTLMLFGSGWTWGRLVHDTIIRSDTVLVAVADTQETDIVLTKEFEGQVWRSLFFEPVDKNTSPFEWNLKKISGGTSVRIPDSEDDAPYIYRTIVKEKGTFRTDTLLNRPDSIHFGIQRLYSFPDSIWAYGSTLDSLEITNIYPILNPQDTSFYFAYGDRYYSLTGFGSDGRIKIGEAVYPNSINYFSVMICPRQGLIYKQAPFKFRVWQMPVRIE